MKYWDEMETECSSVPMKPVEISSAFGKAATNFHNQFIQGIFTP